MMVFDFNQCTLLSVYNFAKFLKQLANFIKINFCFDKSECRVIDSDYFDMIDEI